MKTSHADLGLLQGKMGHALFLYQYARHVDYRYEKYAEKCIDEIVEGIQKMNGSYADGLAGIGVGIEYLVQEGFVEGDTNEILSDFDEVICHIVSFAPNLIDIRIGIIGYGKYYLSRLNNPNNKNKENSNTKHIKEQLHKIVDLLSDNYMTYEDLYFVINFLPDIINQDINKGKALVFLNYTVDLLETMVYEDTFFGKQLGAFNPLTVSVLLFNSSKKINNRDLADRALFFLEKYEPEYRIYLAKEYAIKWAFLYYTLWKACDCDIYKESSVQWLDKVTDNELNFENGDLIISGLMLLSMNESINNDWLDWFPLI
ncbi:hypothetical protein JGH11_02890 [Dysgonomonas sp. Marseille-P4677]|uniref:lanthionine synthetase LanC family protein n=1 Tax=Dysgonomonas sp. Marseille-P4677 TaxID=2364790 RepID=UPI0019137025|nr:lanthionine synthetase LanC family protein [Dysgonomonas sp. Marseille-P4677]MBK5719814.1 hypothetical protein [Dysgonomonas sp. Marseille-P4677]